MDINTLYRLFLNNPLVSTDSRKIEKGCIYFALKGDKFDGNSFALQAIEKGAAHAIIDNREFNLSEKTILVKDVLNTLQALAKHHRLQYKIPVLAITGTNGKTTTKELVREVIAQKYNVLSTIGNLNNHIGVPLTLLSLNSKHEYAIIEMGANHPYEIEQLCQIAQPTHGLITNIGKAHLEGFGGFIGVIKTKRELYEFLERNNGFIFYNSDNELLGNIVDKINTRKESYGIHSGSICRGELIRSEQFISVSIQFRKKNGGRGETIKVNTNLIGEYNLENILAAASIGASFNVPFNKIKFALENYAPDNNRSQYIITPKNKLFVDCYNANPSSTEAAIENFSKISGHDKLVILGDMLELGGEAENEHRLIIQLAKKYTLEAIFVGKVYHSLANSFGYKSFENVTLCNDWINKNPILSKTILIKGSRGIQLEKVIDYL